MRAYTITDTVVNLVIAGKPYCVPRHSTNGEALVRGIRDNLSDAELVELADPTTYINAVGGGVVTVKDGAVRYNGEEMPECLVRRLMDMLSNELPVQHLVNFYERLHRNPSRRAVQELYTFLEHKNIPITPEGKLLMYKAITCDWRDKYSSTVDNHIGATPSMPRNAVCDDADRGCSKGFHAGSLEYVTSFARCYGSEGGDRIVLVEVDPADVVSIPKDCSCQKVRTCKYNVLQEYKGPLPDGGVRDTANPYMDDFDVEYCDECGCELEDSYCAECERRDEEVVLTRGELDDMLDEAAEDRC